MPYTIHTESRQRQKHAAKQASITIRDDDDNIIVRIIYTVFDSEKSLQGVTDQEKKELQNLTAKAKAEAVRLAKSIKYPERLPAMRCGWSVAGLKEWIKNNEL